jgi:hypothetical protein
MHRKTKYLACAVLFGIAGIGTAAHAQEALKVCKNGFVKERCLMDLRNGDFESTTFIGDPYGWQLLRGQFGTAPYIGKTPDSTVLALPGYGAQGYVSLRLPTGSTTFRPGHIYTVKLRARGSGPLPATVTTAFAVGPMQNPEDTRELARHTRTVGWDWQDIEFNIDGIQAQEPALLVVGISRDDENSQTMLQVDDVRIERVSR